MNQEQQNPERIINANESVGEKVFNREIAKPNFEQISSSPEVVHPPVIPTVKIKTNQSTLNQSKPNENDDVLREITVSSAVKIAQQILGDSRVKPHDKHNKIVKIRRFYLKEESLGEN